MSYAEIVFDGAILLDASNVHTSSAFGSRAQLPLSAALRVGAHSILLHSLIGAELRDLLSYVETKSLLRAYSIA